MKEETIIATYTDQNNPAHAIFFDLLKHSLSFMPHEKGRLILDLKSFSDDQLQKIIEALENEKNRNKNLKEKHPDEFNQKKEVTDKTWERLMSEMSEDTHQGKVDALKKTIKGS